VSLATAIPMRRSSVAWVVITAMAAAMLAIPVAQRVDAAAPTCMGQRATIVGTARNDTLNGTSRADVIVGLGGKDRINGRGGNDVICGNGGSDIIKGGGGADRVKGGAGADTIEGNDGNDRLAGSGGDDTIRGLRGDDRIDGGAGTDACSQGAGSGTVVNCESSAPAPAPGPGPAPTPNPTPKPEPTPDPKPDRADLAVTVKAPRSAVSGPVTFTVVVKNNGPDAAKYTLNLALSTQRATCQPVDWAGSRSEDQLAAGKSRSESFKATCTKAGGGAKARLTATVAVKGTDPVSTNDSSTGQARLR
jgi:Ca2+-binding RTX toxin-like protein